MFTHNGRAYMKTLDDMSVKQLVFMLTREVGIMPEITVIELKGKNVA
jgi:hypothetical protein